MKLLDILLEALDRFVDFMTEDKETEQEEALFIFLNGILISLYVAIILLIFALIFKWADTAFIPTKTL